MANEILIKSRAAIECQTINGTDAFKADEEPTDTTWNTTDAYYGGTPEPIDNTYDGESENGQGADYVNLILHVEDAPSSTATAEIWYSESEDGTNYTYYKYSHTIGEIGTVDDVRYDAGIFVLKAQYTRLVIVARDYDIPDATLYAYPKLPEVQ